MVLCVCGWLIFLCSSSGVWIVWNFVLFGKDLKHSKNGVCRILRCEEQQQQHQQQEENKSSIGTDRISHAVPKQSHASKGHSQTGREEIWWEGEFWWILILFFWEAFVVCDPFSRTPVNKLLFVRQGYKAISFRPTGWRRISTETNLFDR